jgi:SulP family sulfate permease
MIFGVSKAIAREHIAIKDADVLIVDLYDVPLLGVTASLAIENAIRDACDQGLHVFVVGAKGKIEKRLQNLGIFTILPPQNIVPNRLEALELALNYVEGNKIPINTNG